MKNIITQIKTCTHDCNTIEKLFITTLGLIVAYGIVGGIMHGALTFIS